MTSTAADLVDEKRERNRAAQRRWRERHRPLKYTKHLADIGPAIAAGEPFEDDFEWCESEWARVLGSAKFTDEAAPRF